MSDALRDLCVCASKECKRNAIHTANDDHDDDDDGNAAVCVYVYVKEGAKRMSWLHTIYL